MKLFLRTFYLLLISVPLQAQVTNDITFDDATYKFGFHASPNGYGLFYRNAVPYKKSRHRRTIYRVYDINFTSIKNIREKSILNQRMVNASPYIYGKVNRLYALRPMFGLQWAFAEKQNRNSVGINVFMLGGPTIGFLKPIYMDIEIPDPNNSGVYIQTSVRYKPELYDHRQITGYSSFGKGIGETKPIAGISIKTGVDFNWGYYSSEYKSIEVGILIDYFPTRPEIMSFIKNKVVYSSFYLSFALGKNY